MSSVVFSDLNDSMTLITLPSLTAKDTGIIVHDGIIEVLLDITGFLPRRSLPT